jgi:hypothetical protein
MDEDGWEGHLQSKFVDVGRADAGITAGIARRDVEGGERRQSRWEAGQIGGGENASNLGLASCGERGRRAEPWCTYVDALLTNFNINLKTIGRKAKHKIEHFLETECKGNIGFMILSCISNQYSYML